MENVKSKKITKARITALPARVGDRMPEVWVVLEGDTEEQQLFSFYPDEIQFCADEFIGLTVEEARELKGRKDVAYLRS